MDQPILRKPKKKLLDQFVLYLEQTEPRMPFTEVILLILQLEKAISSSEEKLPLVK